jgi:hypothetical protein
LPALDQCESQVVNNSYNRMTYFELFKSPSLWFHCHPLPLQGNLHALAISQLLKQKESIHNTDGTYFWYLVMLQIIGPHQNEALTFCIL